MHWLFAPTGQQLLALAVILFGVLTIFTVAGLNSGAFVNAWARFLVFSFGWGAYPMGCLIIALGLLWLRHLVHQPTAWRWRPLLGLELTLVSLLALTHTLLRQHGWTLVQSGQGGGVLGWALSVFFSNYFGPLVAGTLMGVMAILGIGLAFDMTSDDLYHWGQRLAEVNAARRAVREARKRARNSLASKAAAPVATGTSPTETKATEATSTLAVAFGWISSAAALFRVRREQADIEEKSGHRRAKDFESGQRTPHEEKRTAPDDLQPRKAQDMPTSSPAVSFGSESASAPSESEPEKPSQPDSPRASAGHKAADTSHLPADLPPLTLLKEGHSSKVRPRDVRKENERKSRIIEETLSEFGLPVEVTEVRPGPTVTQFGVSPGYIYPETSADDKPQQNGDLEDKKAKDHSGGRKVRVSQIAALSSDLALALAARSLRVEAPVPGRAVVGIEVPNDEIALVSLRAVLQSEEFRKCIDSTSSLGRKDRLGSSRGSLCFAVGLDVAGGPVVADLGSMPHLLVAGTTGSGKSVFVKALAISLVMNNTPDTLRLITIDPKIVELSHFNGLPHLLGKTVTELELSIKVLRWAAVEMDRRYELFADVVARHLDDYNRKMIRKGEKPLPRIVVLIDELADLMMAMPEETERTLTRIAQMARATGIHLVVATQRPSTDVVTGLIKANFPARVSFATASAVDSRVILDTQGAESLLGKGDMLFLPPDISAPIRVQGCHISDEDLEAVINYWQKLRGATPAQAPWEVVAQSEGPEKWRLEGEYEDADLLEQAIAMAREKGKITTSGIQRSLQIGYPRAARLMEQMEAMGLVGPQVSAGRARRVILGGDEDET
jgi:S-DNA-T family DNA segregation ATPase FtsK/SpoIIIE